MPSNYIGRNEVLVEKREDFHVGKGFVTVERWTGLEADLRARQQAQATAGYDTSWNLRAGVNELEIVFPDPDRNPDGSANEKVTDDWAISTQFVEIDVWSDERLRTYLFQKSIPNGTPMTMLLVDAAISTYRATVTDNLKKFYGTDHKVDTTRTGPTPLENFTPKYKDNTPITKPSELQFLQLIYDQIVKGVDKSRAARISLTRRRSIAAKSASRFVVSQVNRAWQPASFYTQFVVPTSIQNLLPAAPGADDTPPGTVWAWALTVQESETSGSAQRIQERLEWIFAPIRAWSFLITPPPP